MCHIHVAVFYPVNLSATRQTKAGRENADIYEATSSLDERNVELRSGGHDTACSGRFIHPQVQISRPISRAHSSTALAPAFDDRQISDERDHEYFGEFSIQRQNTGTRRNVMRSSDVSSLSMEDDDLPAHSIVERVASKEVGIMRQQSAEVEVKRPAPAGAVDSDDESDGEATVVCAQSQHDKENHVQDNFERGECDVVVQRADEVVLPQPGNGQSMGLSGIGAEIAPASAPCDRTVESSAVQETGSYVESSTHISADSGSRAASAVITPIAGACLHNDEVFRVGVAHNSTTVPAVAESDAHPPPPPPSIASTTSAAHNSIPSIDASPVNLQSSPPIFAGTSGIVVGTKSSKVPATDPLQQQQQVPLPNTDAKASKTRRQRGSTLKSLFSVITK